MSIILFLVVLGVLVLVHEWGHFIVAKKTGMRVDEFGIGFPPKALGIQKGETEYTLNWLPIGGFVRIYGENLEDAEQLGEEADDLERSFAARPKWAQALVLVAGVVMNVLFAWLLFVITFMVGVPAAVDEATAGPAAQLYVADTLSDSPAAVIPVTAEIVSVSAEGQNLTRLVPSEFSNFVTTVAPSPISITYDVHETQETVTVVPERGLSVDDASAYMLGISLALVEQQQYSLPSALVRGTEQTVAVLSGIATGLWELLQRSVQGTADFSQIAGPVGIVHMVGDAATVGLVALLTFTAVISLNLAIINLLPIPALDGGRLVFVAIEAITGKHIPAVWAARVNLVGFVLLMFLMVAVTYNDISRLL